MGNHQSIEDCKFDNGVKIRYYRLDENNTANNGNTVLCVVIFCAVFNYKFVVINQVKRPWNVYSGTIPRDFNLLVTPRVKEEVRNHFGCDDLEGAELEDQVIIEKV